MDNDLEASPPGKNLSAEIQPVTNPDTALNIDDPLQRFPEYSDDVASSLSSEEHPSFPTSPSSSTSKNQQPRHLLCRRLCAQICGFCLGSVVGLTLLPIVYTCGTIALILAMSFLLLSLVFVRLLQFIKNGNDYYKATQLKFLIRGYMYFVAAALVLYLGIFFPVAKYVPKIKHTMLSEVPITKWITITCMLCGFYVFSYFLFAMAHLFPPLPLRHDERGMNVPQAISEIIDCLIFWWAESEVMKRVPAFKQVKIQGLPVQQWIKVSIFVLIGYDIITICTHLIAYSLKKACEKIDPGVDVKSRKYFLVEKVLHREYVVYCANGMRKSINFILGSVLLLLTWVLYFGSQVTGMIWEFGTWTCASILILAFLWLIKTCVLLMWEANQVYKRLSVRVLQVRKELYFLGIIGRHKYDIFNLRYYPSSRNGVQNDGSIHEILLDAFFSPLEIANIRHIYAASYEEYDKEDDESGQREDPLGPKQVSSKIWERVKDDFLMQEDCVCSSNPTLHHIQQLAQYFLGAQQALSQESYISDIHHYITNIASAHDHRNTSFEQFLEQLLNAAHNGNDWNSFKELLNSESNRDSLEELSQTQFGIWMEKAHNSCLSLANTLSGVKEVVDCLNKIISGFLVGATFIMWLLLTRLASTKVLVLIASPLLAATFVFGDTCKSLFLGIMFVYVLQPFHIGDLCVIEDKMMEVKTIGVWKTTLSMVSTHETVIYPNSELATKMVIMINYKTKFDWTDRLEFNLNSRDDEKIKTLKPTIENYLNKGDQCMPNSLSIEVSTNKDNMKMILLFKHIKPHQCGTYFECLQLKHKLRSELSIYIWNLIKEHFEGQGQMETSVN